ncbi:hypothetical protein [Nocardia sp. NPDC057668]|uniref:hypothetical protein n=1 Tax=Nocardia sp. NPDC057668 TaxID=3346202 RepID=UPI00366C65DA
MTRSNDVITTVLAAVAAIEGLRPAALLGVEAPSWWLWGTAGYAIDVAADRIEIRVVATRLPLGPPMAAAATAIRTALAQSEYSDAAIRLVVTDLDAVALSDSDVT